MQFPQQTYTWLVNQQFIPNQGQFNDKGNVQVPPSLQKLFDNGYLIGQMVKHIADQQNKKHPQALQTVKNDQSKNTRLTNWNFIWIAFQAIGLKMDNRIKQLILHNEIALIVQVVRQLRERSGQPLTSITIRPKPGREKYHAQPVDVKKINLNKDPQQSESSLQFLMLLLKSSLGMSLEEILGLFTNQNKYLAHIIVKGINENYAPIILFYSLLNKHSKKLKSFYEQDPQDAEACLFAIKPGFISRSSQVASLTAQIFGKFGPIYKWFVSEQSKCASTVLLGLKRHPNLRQLYWNFLMQIVEGQELPFFTKVYSGAFQSQEQLIQITSLLLPFIVQSFIGQKLIDIGVIGSWLEIAVGLDRKNINSQLICFRFIQQLMLHAPSVVEQSQQASKALSRDWKDRSLMDSIPLINQLLIILQNLGKIKSPLARKVYLIIAQVASMLGVGDRRDYLVQNFIPLISVFPSIPAQYLILNLKNGWLSSAEFFLVCQSVEINQNMQTLTAVGSLLKELFLQDPLINHSLASVILAIVPKIIEDDDIGVPFIEKLVQEALHLYSGLEVKFKQRPKQQALYNGRKGAPQKISKDDAQEQKIKQKWKQLLLSLIQKFQEMFSSQRLDDLHSTLKDKILQCNAQIRLLNHKVGSRALEDLLLKKFSVSRQEQIAYSQDFFSKKNASYLQQSSVRHSKVHSQSVSHKLKGPQHLTKQLQLIVDKRKQSEQERKALQLKKQFDDQKRKMSQRKEIEIANLLRGQVGQAQIREEGLLEKLIPQSKQIQAVPLEQLQDRQVEAARCLLNRYHKVSRQLFLYYTGTMYDSHLSHNNQKFQNNQQRKETLTQVQLLKMLKDYRLAFLASNSQIINLVRDINVRLLHRKDVVSQLDFGGFQMFLMQFCLLFFTRSHTTTLTTNGQFKSTQHVNLKGQPLHVIVKQLFVYLKSVFQAKGEKTSAFDQNSDLNLTPNQLYELDILSQKLKQNSSYILPKGYKKIAQHNYQFQHKISSKIQGLSQSFIVAFGALDYIVSNAFASHIIEDVSTQVHHYRIKPILASRDDFPRELAMSTMIERKNPLIGQIPRKQNVFRTISKGMLGCLKLLPAYEMAIGKQVALVLDEMVESVSSKRERELERKKKAISIAKLQQVQKIKIQFQTKKMQEKQQANQQLLQKEKLQQKKRREHTEKFLEEQRLKLAEKKKRQQQIRQKKQEQEEQLLSKKKDNKEKFKAYHQGNLQKIKKIHEEVADKLKKGLEGEQESKERNEELHRRLREKIEEEDKKIIQAKREAQRKIITTFESESIQRTFKHYDSAIRALYDFLLQHTFLPLSQRKHNNQIIFDTWRYFLIAFELSPLIVLPKDVPLIFKTLTKDKVILKEYFVGLNYKDFQQALFRIAIKYKSVFNLIAEKIKDAPVVAPPAQEVDAKNKGKGKGTSKPKQKPKLVQEDNEFEQVGQINVKQLMKENNEGKDVDGYGDISKVNQKTLLAVIYYLKVPLDKVGQEKRFRQILVAKHPSGIMNSLRLQQKLKEQYRMSPTPREQSKTKIQTPAVDNMSSKSPLPSQKNLAKSPAPEQKKEAAKLAVEQKKEAAKLAVEQKKEQAKVAVPVANNGGSKPVAGKAANPKKATK